MFLLFIVGNGQSLISNSDIFEQAQNLCIDASFEQR